MERDQDFTWENHKEQHSKLLDKFIEKEFKLIQKEFAKEGLNIKSTKDISTFIGWGRQGRKIVKGKKSLLIEGENLYPQILFNYGMPILNEKGEKEVRKMKKSYNLFAIDQTEERKKEYD